MKKILPFANILFIILFFVVDKLLDYYISNSSNTKSMLIQILDSQYSIRLIQVIIFILILFSLVPYILDLIRSPLKTKVNELTQVNKDQKYLLESKTAALVSELQDIFNFYEKEILYYTIN